MADHVSGYSARYGLVYRGLGRYGTAIRYLEQVRAERSPNEKQYFFASAILLDIHTAINSRHAVNYASELAELSRGRAVDQSAGHYHLFLGDRKHKAGEYEAALDEYSTALEIYSTFRAEDDLVRTQIAKGHSLLALGQTDRVAGIIKEVSKPIGGLESRIIKVEYDILRLRCGLRSEAGSAALKDAISKSRAHGAHIADMRTRMALHASLFHAHNRLGEKTEAAKHFRRFYSDVKTVCSDLPNTEYIEDFVSDGQFVELVDRFRSL
jgi:tetratricopeptide (TPR) repeat protein